MYTGKEVLEIAEEVVPSFKISKEKYSLLNYYKRTGSLHSPVTRTTSRQPVYSQYDLFRFLLILRLRDVGIDVNSKIGKLLLKGDL